MTEEGENALVCFLNLSSDYLRDGHTRFREAVGPRVKTAPEEAPEEEPRGEHGLPLAYLIEEPGDGPDESEQGDPAAPPSADSIEAVEAEAAACKACALAATRTHAVPGEGAKQPLVMVIGEGPGADEDAQGRPFVGRAGQLLDKMLESIGLSRDKNCYIANMVKCRPPGNRDPQPGEQEACIGFLREQVRFIRPKIIVCLGRIAAMRLISPDFKVTRQHGEFFEKNGVLMMGTFHPAALLRNPNQKPGAFEDFIALREKLKTL